jgi:hypothetical protein
MSSRQVISAAICALLLALAPPLRAQSSALDCSLLRGQPALVATLYFGRRVAGRAEVSEKEWQDFLARSVTPRFPDGLTVIDGQGQWRSQRAGSIVRERTKMLVIAIDRPAGDASPILAKLDAIAAAYEQRFHQQKVGLVLSEGCGAF